MKPNKDTIQELKGENWSYQAVARAAGIEPVKFEKLMVNRFDEDRGKEGKDYHLPYAAEWAERIRRRRHFNAADRETKAVLKEVGYDE